MNKLSERLSAISNEQLVADFIEAGNMREHHNDQASRCRALQDTIKKELQGRGVTPGAGVRRYFHMHGLLREMFWSNGDLHIKTANIEELGDGRKTEESQ